MSSTTKFARFSIFVSVAAISFFISRGAFAGKAERDYMKEIVKPAMESAEKAYQDSCGCSLKIVADPAFKSKDQLGVVRSVSDSLRKGITKHCVDKESNAAMCKMKTLKINRSEEKTEFKFSGSTGVATCEDDNFISFDQMAPEVDK